MIRVVGLVAALLVALPAAAQESGAAGQGGVVKLDIDVTGTVRWSTTVVDRESLASRFAELARVEPPYVVEVSVDARTEYQHVNVVRMMLQQAGLQALRFRPSGLTLLTPFPPPPDAPGPALPSPIRISVASDGSASWNGRAVTREKLEANLKAEAQRAVRPMIRIEPHRFAHYGAVDAVHLLAKQAGLESGVEELPFIGLPDFIPNEPKLVEPDLSTSR